MASRSQPSTGKAQMFGWHVSIFAKHTSPIEPHVANWPCSWHELFEHCSV